MRILDTNVLSARMQRQPDLAVVEWLDRQSADTVWITSVSLFETRYGLKLLADGERKALLVERLDELVQLDLANRIAVFDVRAAEQAASLAADRKARGRPMDVRDTFIAGSAIAEATRAA